MDLLIENLLGPVMVLTRISAFFLVVPVFGWKSIPVRIKVSITFLLTIFFAFIIPVPLENNRVTLLEAILLLSNEAIYGFALGLIVSLVFSAVRLGGRIVERQIGLAMAEILDPLTGERTQPLGSLLEMVLILLFLSANGHHLLLLIISRSYDSFPAGSIPTIQTLTTGIIQAGSTMFISGLKISAPILAAFLVLMVVLAILARIVPEMNILFISLPLRVGLGLLMMTIFVPFIGSFVSEFADFMNKLLPI